MKFIQINELKTRKFQDLIDDVSEKDFEILNELEDMAISEISMYLRSRYNVQYAFSRTGTDRNPLLKRLVLDYILCHLWERTNSNEIPDSLSERCEKNRELLMDIANGKLSPDIPTIDPSTGMSIIFEGGSEPQFNI